MNERIKELMFESGLGYMSSAHPILVEKFAELIIQECLLAISHTPIESDEIGTMVRCHNQVEQHFGVEE